jgi:chromate reductase, NAD(P)H dehydrogenase (quinone)
VTTPITILAMSGSLRADSSNRRVLQAAAMLAPAGVEVSWFDALDSLPHFNPDLDGPRRPAPVQAFRRQLAESDALLLSSPEYAHGVPGSLKNALDWLVSGVEIAALPTGLLNPSPHSTHAQPALIETLRTMSADVIAAACVILPLSGRPLAAAEIVADPALANPLRTAVGALAEAAFAVRRDGRRLTLLTGGDGGP